MFLNTLLHVLTISPIPWLHQGPLKCKTCITELQTKERLAAESRRSQLVEHSEVTSMQKITCIACKVDLPINSFNRNQIAKKEKARCRECVDKAVKSDELTTMKAKQDKVAEANEELRIAEAKGNAFEISKAASKVAALEAEHVTGLKPRVLGKGGRGRSRLRR